MEERNIGRFIKILSRLTRELRCNITPDSGFPINKTEFITLMELKTNPGLPMKHYQRTAGIESGSFTYLADDLERKGLIRRVTAREDRRMTVLELTEQGRHVAGSISARVDAHVAERIACLSDEQHESFISAMSVLEDILTQLEKQHG